LDLSLLQDILIVLVGGIIYWVKIVLEKKFEDTKTDLGNLNKNLMSAISQTNIGISNLNAAFNTFSLKNAQNQNQHIHIYNVPEVIKTNPEEIKDVVKQNESNR